MKKITKVLCMALAMLMLSVGCTKKSSEKQILSFRFESLSFEYVIVEETKTISITVPFGTNITNLAPVIVVSEKATVNPGSNVPMDFTHPVVYTVTAEDGSQAFYTAIVTVEALTDKSFVGTWGVEKIEYYNTDYAGNPISASMETFNFDPYDIDNGIQLVFRPDMTGEMRDHSKDTAYIMNDTIIYPDFVIITQYTYSYVSDEVLHLNLENGNTYDLNIVDFSWDSFVYENEYSAYYVEKAYLKRLSNTPSKFVGKKAQPRPRKQGSLLGSR